MTWPICPVCDRRRGFDYTLDIEHGHSLWPGAESGNVQWAVCRGCNAPVSLEFHREATKMPSFIPSENQYDPSEHVRVDNLDRNLTIKEDGKVIAASMSVCESSGTQTGEWWSSFRVAGVSRAS